MLKVYRHRWTGTETFHRDAKQQLGCGFSLHPVFTDETSAFVGVHRIGKFFTALGVGTREDFYGHHSGHDSVFEAGLSVGHENAFLRFSG